MELCGTEEQDTSGSGHIILLSRMHVWPVLYYELVHSDNKLVEMNRSSSQRSTYLHTEVTICTFSLQLAQKNNK